LDAIFAKQISQKQAMGMATIFLQFGAEIDR
jgi:hypothetical protein